MDLILMMGWLALRDSAVSPRTYHGPQLELGAQGRVGDFHASLILGAGRLTPAGWGARSFPASFEDPLSGETLTGRRRSRGLWLHGSWDVGWERTVGAVVWGDASYTQALAFNTWAMHAVRLGPQVHLESESHGFRARVGIASVVTRLPWSLDPLKPGKGLVAGFFASGTRVAGPWSHLAADATYTLKLGKWRLDGTVSAMFDQRPAPLVSVRPAVALRRSL